MRVILNVAPLKAPFAGVGHYTLRLAEGMQNHAEIEELHLFSSFSFVSHLPSVRAKGNWAGTQKQVKRLPLASALYHSTRKLSFRWQSRKMQDALYHEPNFLLMPFAGKSVATIHDLSYLNYPQYHPKERITRLERQLPKTLAQGQHFITDSEFIRQEIIEKLGVAPQKITAIPLGVDTTFKPRSHTECVAVLTRYGLQNARFLLAVGTLEPRKNIKGLLLSYQLLPEKMRRAFSLVLVGAKGWMGDQLPRECVDLVASGQVILLGFVPPMDLPHLYSAALAFVYPSFYEGFGLPPLEAMASGVPVMISDRASLPEVTGGHALLVDPEDQKSIASGLSRLIEDGPLRANLIQSGLDWAGAFSWQRTVARTIEVYRLAQSY